MSMSKRRTPPLVGGGVANLESVVGPEAAHDHEGTPGLHVVQVSLDLAHHRIVALHWLGLRWNERGQCWFPIVPGTDELGRPCDRRAA